MLAADLRETGSDPLNPDDLAEAERRGLRTAQFTSFATVVVAGDASQLASLYAVSDGYPLRGQVRLADAVDSTSSYTVASAPPAGRVWLEDGLLARLGADVGAAVSIGAREFVVDRVLEHRPDQSLGFDTFAPVADDESRRPRVDGAHPARRPRDLCAALRRRRGRRRGVSRVVRDVERRRPAPADGRPLRGTHRPSDRARRAVLELGVHDRAAAGGDGGCGLRPPLCGATSRGRRAAEVPRRFAGARARGHLARARASSVSRPALSAARSATSRSSGSARSSRTSWSSSCRRRAWRPA